MHVISTMTLITKVLTICFLWAEAWARLSSEEVRLNFISSTSSLSIFSFCSNCCPLKDKMDRPNCNSWSSQDDNTSSVHTIWLAIWAPRFPLWVSGWFPPCSPRPVLVYEPLPAASGCSAADLPHRRPDRMSLCLKHKYTLNLSSRTSA